MAVKDFNNTTLLEILGAPNGEKMVTSELKPEVSQLTVKVFAESK